VTRRIQIERAAELDIAEITIALRERQPASATKFVKAARAAFRLLATQPEMGRRYQTTHPLLRNLRVWQVKWFEVSNPLTANTRRKVFSSPQSKPKEPPPTTNREH
jgi:plasmid stabilization system protein ParE